MTDDSALVAHQPTGAFTTTFEFEIQSLTFDVISDDDKDRTPTFPVDRSGLVSSPGCILDEKDVAPCEAPNLTVRNLDLDVSVEHDDVLALGGIVPVVVIVGRVFPKDDSTDCKAFGQASDLTRFGQFDVNVLEVRRSVRGIVYARDVHVR